MAYRLRDREGMASGVRRIVSEELDKAIDQLRGRRDSDQDEAVHDARKRLKKARSALRLVRDDIGDEVRGRENRVMRDAGRSLSGVRDAQVLLETLDSVASDRRGSAPPDDAVGSLRRSLERRRQRHDDPIRDDGAQTAGAARELAGVLERADGWPLADEGFGAARAGLERIHRRGRRAMAEALDRGGDESWHEWRKRVKDLWYCARILEPVAPGPIGGIVGDADELSDVLGNDHDLALLEAALDDHRDTLGEGRVQLFHAAVARRREELRLAAIPLGKRLYTEKPKAFARRLEAYWDARAAQEAAQAHWLTPEVAARTRRLLAEKSSAAPATGRRITSELRDLGFRVTDFAEHVPRRPGGFGVEDFDELVARGIVRVGSPGSAEAIPA